MTFFVTPKSILHHGFNSELVITNPVVAEVIIPSLPKDAALSVALLVDDEEAVQALLLLAPQLLAKLIVSALNEPTKV